MAADAIQVYRNASITAVNESDLEASQRSAADQERALQLITSALTCNEMRRSKSKVRSYLRRCREVISGHHHQNYLENATGDRGLCPIATHEPVQQQVLGDARQEDEAVAMPIDKEGETETREQQQIVQLDGVVQVSHKLSSCCDLPVPRRLLLNRNLKAKDVPD